MTDRQRAFVCSLVYVARNDKFTNYHSIGVKRLPDGAVMYEFKGSWEKDSLDTRDDKYNRMMDDEYFQNPYGIKIKWFGQRRTERIKLKMPLDQTQFRGIDGDYYRFEGTYYHLSDKIEIRDYSQDRYKYVYRIIW